MNDEIKELGSHCCKYCISALYMQIKLVTFILAILLCLAAKIDVEVKS